MSVFSRYLISLLVALTSMHAAVLQAAVDSRGTEFMFAFPPNYNNSGNLSLFISSETDAQGTVDIAGLGFVETFSVVANTVTEITLPRGAQVTNANSVLERGIRIVSDEEISVYGLNQYRATTDAFLVLPVDTLGLEYLNMSYAGLSGSYPSQMLVTGVYDDTEVRIKPSEAATGHPAGTEFSIVLNAGDSYLLQANGRTDLTGTELNASAPVSVMGAVKCVNVPIGYRACDHIVEMLPPVSTWGQSFVTVPLSTRKKGDVFRVLASEDGTDVLLDGVLTVTLQRGEFHEQILTQRRVIETTAPVSVAQYSPGQSFDGVTSDPFMMLIPPSEQFLDQYNFSTLTQNVGFQNSFVNVVAPASALSSMQLDGQLVDQADFVPIGSSGFSGAQIQVEGGTHNMAASEPFGIYVYGFGSYDSYGYPGGMSFDLINPRGDAYAPNSRLELLGDFIIGHASDSEDINANGVLDAGEDINGNGDIDRRSEDINHNGLLDDGEDVNGDGQLDRDRGIFRIELQDADNLALDVVAFVPGDLAVDFVIRRVDASLPASGNLFITDGAGNSTVTPIEQFSETVLSGVSVISTLSDQELDVVESSFSETPVRIEQVGDTTEIEWQFDAFSVDQVTTLNYDVVMRNPVPGETRLVLHSLEMRYTDVNGNPVTIALGTQSVTVAPSVFTLSTATDKSRYQAGEIVDISTTIRNDGEADDSATLIIHVIDAQGVTVQAITQQPFTVSSNNTRLIDDTPFNVGNLLTGDYTVVAQLVNDGTVVRQADASFTVVTQSDTLMDLAADARAQRASYAPWEVVDIRAELQNLAGNSLVNDIAAELRVVSPDGQVLLQQERAILQLAPSSLQQFNFDLPLDKAPEGDYKIIWTARGADADHGVLASAVTTFSVINDQNAAVVGEASALLDQLFIGESQTCDYRLENIGITDISGVTVRYQVVNIDDQTVMDTERVTLNPVAGAVETLQRSLSTQHYAAGQYACVLDMTLAGEQRTLAQDQFVLVDPVHIDVDLQRMSSPRLLVLVDPGQSVCASDASAPGCTDTPEVPERDNQNQALDTVLADRSYARADSLDAFKTELLSGQYQQYLLLSEHQPLDRVTADLLREAVNRGEGVVFATGRAPVEASVSEWLGHEPSERECASDQITIADRPLSELHVMDVGTVPMNQTIRGTQQDDYIKVSGAVRNAGSISGASGDDIIHLLGWDNARNTSVTGDGGYNILMLNEYIVARHQARGTHSGTVEFTSGGSAVYNNFQEVRILPEGQETGCADSSSNGSGSADGSGNSNSADTIADRPLSELNVMDVGTVQMNQTVRGTQADDYIKVSGAVRNAGSILGGHGDDVIHLAGWGTARNTSVTGDGGYNVLVLNEQMVSRHQPRGTNSGTVEFTSGGNAVYNNFQHVILLPEDECAVESGDQSESLHATGVRFLDTPISSAQDVLFGLDRSLPEVVLKTATLAGTFLNPQYQRLDKPDCNEPVEADIPAVTFYDYGQGQSVFIGYDLLAELTATGVDTTTNPHTELLLNSLTNTLPAASTEPDGSSVVAVEMTVTNLGIETPVTAVIHWPSGSQVIDNLPPANEHDASAVWSSTLGVDQVLRLNSWAIPQYGTVVGHELTDTVIAELFIGDDLTATPRERIERPLQAYELASIERLRQDWLTAIQTESDTTDHAELVAGQEWFEQAVLSQQQGNQGDAVSELLQATHHLKTIESEQVVALRLLVGRWIRQWSQPLSSGQQLPNGEQP